MKPLIFYYVWPEEEKPFWDNWVLPWRNTELSLHILSKTFPERDFDLFNPRIRWVKSLEKDAICIRLPFATMIPKGSLEKLLPTRFCVRSNIGGYKGCLFPDDMDTFHPLEGFWLECPDPDWKALFAKTPLNKKDARLWIKACQELGEWTALDKVLPLCNFEPDTFSFYKSLIKWANNRSNPNRSHKLLCDLMMTAIEDSWIWMIKHFDPEDPWEKNLVLSTMILNNPDNQKDKSLWVETIKEKDLMRLITPHHLFRTKIWEKTLFTVRNRDTLGLMLRRWPFLNLLEETTDAIKGNFYHEIPTVDDFVSSSVGIVPFPTNPLFYVVNIRSVNYRIQQNGSYKSFLNGKECCPYNGITENYCCLVDRETLEPLPQSWRKMKNDQIPYFNEGEKAIVGVEDIRLIDRSGEVWFYGCTKEFSYNEKIRIITGKYNIEKGILENSVVIRPPLETPCEKNWTFVEENMFIYKWFPLQIGVFDREVLSIKTEKETPLLFQELRGSSPCRRWKNLFWTVAHAVFEENGLRKYIHFMIALSTSDLSLTGISEPFVFEQLQIEYCCGMDIFRDKFLLAYSTQDKTSKYIRIDAVWFLQKMIWLPKERICIPV